MNEKDIKLTILHSLKQIAPEIEQNSLTMEEDIRLELNLDSFDFLQLMIAIADKTGIEIKEKDYGKITSLQSLIDYLRLNR